MKLDLGYGNPSFLQELWKLGDLLTTCPEAHMPYSFSKTNNKLLEENILSLHKEHKNVRIDKNTKIIIGNGATQVLSAALYAYKKMLMPILSEPHSAHLPAPYWGRLATLIKKENFQVETKEFEGDIELITIPNNPDGTLSSDLIIDIADCCYNWPHYVNKPILVDAPVVVFSLSKLSGHSSTRIGWALVNDTKLYKDMQEYIFLFTAGVSIDAQLSANRALDKIAESTFFPKAENILQIRHRLLHSIVYSKSLPIEIISERGLFWYVKSHKEFIDKLNVDYVSGTECGQTDDFFRFNIGCDTVTFEEFTKRLQLL